MMSDKEMGCIGGKVKEVADEGWAGQEENTFFWMPALLMSTLKPG
jgi:hypothetical protein